MEACPWMQMHIQVKLSNEALTLHIDMWFHITLYFVYWAISKSTELKIWHYMVLKNHDRVIENPFELWSNSIVLWLRIHEKLVIKHQISFVFEENLRVFKCTLCGTKLWIFWTIWSLNAKAIIITIFIIIWCNCITNINCVLILILL